jgi:hypothetical protein
VPGETPDYGRLSAQTTVYPVTDLGELAARLGSPVIFNRSGDVLHIDDFEAGVEKWPTDSLDGTGAAAYLSLAEARSGLFSYRLVGGSTATGRTRIAHTMPFPVLSRLGLEYSFNLPGSFGSIAINMRVFDGTNVTEYELRYTDTGDQLAYLDSGGTYTNITPTISLNIGTPLFHNWKLVVDATAGQYVKLLLNASTYDLSGIGARVTASATAPIFQPRATIISRAGQNDSMYVDDAIVTQNEPA